MVVDPSSKMHKIRPRVTFLLSGLALVLVAAQSGPAAAAPNPLRGAGRQQLSHLATGATPTGARALDEGDDDGGHEAGDDPMEVADRAEQYANERSAPAGSVSAAALLAARQQAAGLPVAPAVAREVTTQTLDAEPEGYSDPTWSNEGAGFRDVSGRVTALAVDGHTYYTGAADGGVWKSNDAGRHWYSIWDQADTLSIGALLVGPHHALWVGTGEANTSSDSYRGTGVYRSTNGGRSFQRVGGDQLVDRMVFRLVDDGVGHVYAATSQGLYRHSSDTAAGPWTLVLKPDPNPDGTPYRTSFISDVVVRPGTHGRTVLAVLGWRSGSPYNGFYLSTTGGGAGSFAAVTPTGAINTADIGRTTLAYAADGSRLYALIESPTLLATPGSATNLQGVFASASGNPTGPYTKIADSDKLGASGSALQSQPGYHVGVQSWYNQALAVDPKDPMHAFVSLEEVFQTTDGGATFTTASPYWNYGLACGEDCPPATHPDQHALALTSDGKVVIGNDGGVYQRPMSLVGYGNWQDLNTTLHTLQYYDAKAGKLGSGLGYWGGLQDNGTSLLIPGAAKNIEPAGGDGGDVLVDPNNANRSVGEYTNLALYSTTDGGHTFNTIAPECGWLWTDKVHCDPSARFIAPFVADSGNTNHWVAVGNKVWDTTKGWDTRCAGATCDWTNVHDLGLDAAGGYNVGTAVAVNGATTYAAFVDSGANPSPTFRSGIDTNYGGTWHRISSPVLPNRYITGLTVDPANPAHVYAIFNGYSRRWIPGGGTGVVFESTDGGAHWRDLSGNLPDAPGDALALSGNNLVLATDVGVFVASRWAPTRWSRVLGMPHVVVDNVTPLAGRNAVVAGTHGRGIWRIDLLF
jgi:hypothetical protein